MKKRICNHCLQQHLKKILVVDDNETNLELMKAIFEYFNLPLQMANNPITALQMITESEKTNQPFDLIIQIIKCPEWMA